MNCPYCNKEETSVLESRVLSGGDGVRRRRKCLSCQKRFTTHERVVNIDLKIIKKSGKIEQYDREKLLKGLAKALYKRSVTTERTENLVDEIEAKLLSMVSTEVKSCDVGKLVLQKLKKIDQLAYMRFASVYMDFKDIKDFKKFIGEIPNKLISKKTK